MNELLALIARHGGYLEITTGDTIHLGECTEHAEHPVPPAVAEITSVDVADGMRPCGDCLARAIQIAQEAAVEAGDQYPRVTVTASRDAINAASRPAGSAAAA